MNLNIIEAPFCVTLVGKRGPVPCEAYGETGLALMESMWPEFAKLEIEHSGSIDWVYLPDEQLFTGVELTDPPDDTGELEILNVTLSRYLRHVHRGPYSELSRVWQELKQALKAEGEASQFPCLELYGSCKASVDPPETTILIGLHERPPRP